MTGTYDFHYLIDKVVSENFQTEPFDHLEINSFFSDEHFQQIISSPELRAPNAKDDANLIAKLEGNGFKSIKFPGAVTNKQEYLRWHRERDSEIQHHTACEGFGYVMRLYDQTTPILKELESFLKSDKFLTAICSRFGISIEDVHYDGGIQKYLDGYEISPHPDIRRKAATFMVNINPSELSEQMNHHTHYMKLIEARRYVQSLWEGNPSVERAWVPWDWACTVKQQWQNNSIVLFAPSNDTLHAVRSDYNHLITQRTQLYGNLWFVTSNSEKALTWENLDLLSNATAIERRTDVGQGQRSDG